MKNREGITPSLSDKKGTICLKLHSNTKIDIPKEDGLHRHASCLPFRNASNGTVSAQTANTKSYRSNLCNHSPDSDRKENIHENKKKTGGEKKKTGRKPQIYKEKKKPIFPGKTNHTIPYDWRQFDLLSLRILFLSQRMADHPHGQMPQMQTEKL